MLLRVVEATNHYVSPFCCVKGPIFNHKIYTFKGVVSSPLLVSTCTLSDPGFAADSPYKLAPSRSDLAHMGSGAAPHMALSFTVMEVVQLELALTSRRTIGEE